MLPFIGLLLVTSFPRIPDISMTMGDYCSKSNPDFQELRYGEQIAVCKRNVTPATKAKIYDNYGISQSNKGEFTIDHLIPLSLGGSNSVKNLWPQHKSIYSGGLEYKLFQDVQAGKIKRDVAVKQLLDYKFNITTK